MAIDLKLPYALQSSYIATLRLYMYSTLLHYTVTAYLWEDSIFPLTYILYCHTNGHDM